MEREIMRTLPLRYVSEITPEVPINPGMWKITGIDTSVPHPPERADFCHGLVIVDDPSFGTCILLNKDGGDVNGHYFNLIGGASEPHESPQQTFTREMIEETGMIPDTNRLQYIGLIETANAPATPLYAYKIQPKEVQSSLPITGSQEFALVPVWLLKKTVPVFPWKEIGL